MSGKFPRMQGPPPGMWRGPGNPPRLEPLQDPFANPFGTVPGPFVGEVRGHWIQPTTTLAPQTAASWDAVFGPVAGVVSRIVWQSVIIDLRWDLRGSDGDSNGQSQPVMHGAAFGAGINLVAVFGGLDAIPAPLDINVYTMEALHPFSDLEIQYVCNRQDITSEFFDGNEDTGYTALSWQPAPTRFWKVAVIIDQMSGAFGAMPALTVRASGL